MTLHKFVFCAPVNPYEGSVTIDGKPLDGIVRASVELRPNGPTTLKLEIIGEVIVEGEYREIEILTVAREHSGPRGAFMGLSKRE